MKIKHSKFRNTGILFELLVRQVTVDTLKGVDSPAIDIMKKYFVKSELGKEYKLYESLLKSKVLNEDRANTIVSTILESSKNLNKSSLKRQKYNLIKEIKDHYDLDIFFGIKIKNYKELASIYTLIEGYNSTSYITPSQMVDCKITLLEFLTNQNVDSSDKREDILKEFQSYDKDLRILTYKVLLEKFNEKYNSISPEQKQILKEYINSVDSAPDLRNFYNSRIQELKHTLKAESKTIKNQATQIKISEISKYLTELDKNSKVDDSHLIDLLQYHELIQEIRLANGVSI
jgi:Ca2+-binding EF-hand superfamily protein